MDTCHGGEIAVTEDVKAVGEGQLAIDVGVFGGRRVGGRGNFFAVHW